MRISRSIQLHPESGSLHMFWRCHNKEYYLSNNYNKALYMQAVRESLNKEVTDGNVFIHAYCVMSNHYHQASSYQKSSVYLSKYMRQAHTLFGMRYNRNNKRSGKVAEARPKTSLVENLAHEMRVHFYVESNPIRAGICKLENLKVYKYSSYRFYAFGISDENSTLLTFPSWYLELGDNPTQRQKKYRALFREYINETKENNEERSLYKKPFIGSIYWSLKENKRALDLQKYKISNTC